MRSTRCDTGESVHPLGGGPDRFGDFVDSFAPERREVTDGLRQLRELAKSKIGGSNGHARQAVPG